MKRDDFFILIIYITFCVIYITCAFRYSDEPPWDDEMEERLYVRQLVTSKFHDAGSSRLSEMNGRATTRSEKRDSPRVIVRRIDLSASKFRVAARRRRADWSSLGYGSDDRSRGRALPAQVPLKDSIGIANETTARDDRARDRRRTSSARGTTCGIQIGPSVHIVDRELTRQDLEDVHISPESSRAQSRANTATYTLRHDVVRNANDPEEAPRTRRVRLDTLQREKPSGKLIIEDTIEAVPTNPTNKSEMDFERIRNSDSGLNDGRIESPKVRIYGQERKDRKPEPRNAEGTEISKCLKNATSRGAIKFAVIETDRSEKLRNKARNENREGIASGGDTEIRHAENGGIFCERSDADCSRDDENIVDKIQAEENRGDRSKPPSAGDTSRKASFPRRANIASRYREAESSILYRTIDGHFSHAFNNHNGQDGLCDAEDAHRLFASNYTDVSRAEDNLDEIDLYRPRLDDLDSILHSNDRKIERVVRATRNLSELLSGPEFVIYKLDEGEPRDANHEKLRDSLADKDDKYSNESTRSSILETELRNEDLTVSEVQTDEDPKGANTAGTRSSAKDNGSRSNYSKNSVESSVFPASDASDDLRTSRDIDKRSAAEARLSESSIDRSDITTFSNLVPALSSTHTETQMCRLREEETAGSDRHAESRVTSARKFPKRKIRRSGKEYIDEIFARLSRKDAFQVTDQLVAYMLQDEKQSIEGKIVSALKRSMVTPATLQKLLDHLHEAESIRDARQAETLDILKNILINVKSQSEQKNIEDKKTFSRNVSAGTQASAVAIDGLTPREGAQTKIEASEVAKNSYELKSPGGHSVDLSETRGSGRTTARCESTRCSENNRKGDTSQKVDVAEIVSIDAKNQMDKAVDENDSRKQETILQARARNNTSDVGPIADKFKDSNNPDKYLSVSPAFPEVRESVHAAGHLKFRDSKNNSKNNSKGNSEAESLKQISDIHNDDENPGQNSERLSAKIASARSRGEAVDSVTAVFENKDDVSSERLEEDRSNDAPANKDQHANQIIAQTERMIEALPNIKEEAVKEIKSEKTRDIIPSADKKVLFAVSEVKNERVRSDASPVKPKFTDESPAKTDIYLTRSSTREDTGSPRKREINPRHIVVKEKIDPADNCSSDPPRDRIAPSGVKSSGSSSQEVASRNRQISPAGENNSKGMTNGETRKSTTFENRRGRNEGLGKIARSDDERRSVDLTERPRNYKINVLSSSNSSVSSTLLDHDR